MDVPAASLGVAMGFPVTASLGPVGPLLRQLRELTTCPNGVTNNQIQSLTTDLMGLCINLMHRSEFEAESSTAKCWMREVRELCYDTKNYLDDAQFISNQEYDDAELTPQEKLENAQFEFQMLEARAKNARLRIEINARLRIEMYAMNPKGINNPTNLLSPTGRRLPVLHPVPIDRYLMDKLADMLLRYQEEEKLKVVSLVGFEGVGKTTLARRIYHKIGGQFQCGAFVRVSRNPDIRRLLTTIFTQIQQLPPAFSPFSEGTISEPASCLDAQALITNIKDYLRGKRYFITIDDLWSTSVWDIIKRAFPDDGCHSTIITTTQFRDVALACCSYHSKYMFEIKSLNGDQSRELFFGMVFGSKDEVSFPEDFGEVPTRIIEKCAGLPLSIVNIASLLPTPSKLNLQEWMDIRDSLPSTLRANPTSEGIKQVLNLVYNNLSPQLKTCLLYLVLYPEGCTISKDDLVKQWVIEGIIEDGENKEEVAGGYFDELVSRGMIQAVGTNNRRVLSCTLHHMVHQLIVKKSIEANFIVTMDCFQSAIGLPDKVRRMSVQFGSARSAKIPAGITLSEVRSLAFFGFYGCTDFIEKCKLLRVLILHLWADQDKVPLDLSGISKLLPLRYVKITCKITVKLPDKIQALQYLETLEVDAPVVAIPSDIGGLSRLSSLKIAVSALSRQDICILQELGALAALSVDVKEAPTEWIVFGKGGFLVLEFFTIRCSAPRLLIEDSAMPKIEKLNLCINAHEAPPQDGKKPVTIEHLASLKEISVKIWGAVADKGFALTNAITNDARNPIPTVQLMEEADTSHVQGMTAGIEVHKTFDLNGGDYAAFISVLIDVLVKHDDVGHVQGHPILGKQMFPKEPKRWMHIKLVAGMSETTLAVRDDNLNFIGFQPKNGRWYELGFSSRSTPMLPGSTFLGYDCDYADLLQIDHDDPQERNRLVREEMVKLELGRQSAIAAVSLLSGYKKEENFESYRIMEAPDRHTRRALARLMLMFCEATWMIPSFNTVLASWDEPARSGSCRIRKEDALYIWYWGKMSAALLEWETTGYNSWGPNETTTMLAKEINVKSAQEALAVVQVLLNTPANNAITRGGRPLVEVFGVRADSGIVDTISVFDGRRGQIIYRFYYSHRASTTRIHHSPSSSQMQGMLDLALTGPYRAISAEGSFVIQVNAHASDKPSADMCWDCYSDKAVYNKVLVHDMSTDKGQFAEVTYAVLSDAMEVTVQVELLSSVNCNTAYLYGEITAHNRHYGGNSVVLFSRAQGEETMSQAAHEEETMRRSRAERMERKSYAKIERQCMVPLARSVLAVPLGSSLEIKVNLTACLSKSEKISFKEDIDFSLIDRHVGEIRRHNVVVQLTSMDVCALPDTTLPAQLATTRVPGMTSIRTEAGMPSSQPVHVYMDFNCCSGKYGAFMDDLCEKLAEHPGKAVVHGRPVLARQRCGKPARLFMITLAGDKDYERVTLAVRDDNLSLVGFKNQYEIWYEFGMKPWLQESGVELGSDGSYESLLGKAKDRWQKLKLGRKSAIDAIRTLSAYKDRQGHPVDEATKRELARLMVMICEAARLAEIYDTMKKGWEGKICITERQVQYIDNWENISRFLLGRRRRVRNIGLENEEDAAAAVKMVLNPTCPLVEVFGVYAYPSFSIRAISAVDDKGSKVIIYNNPQAQRDDAPSSQEVDYRRKETEQDLPPTATYRPVSADGEIHIQFHGNPTTHTRLTLVWDGHSDKAAYNKIKTHKITTSQKTKKRHEIPIADSMAEFYVDSAVELTYAVLRDAVEATVKVHLNLKEHEEARTVTSIYGVITATNQHYDGKSILLFRHPKEQAVKPEVNALDTVSIPLKLMRDFIVASLECALVINVSLRAVCSNSENPVCLDEELRFEPNMGSEHMKKIDAPTMEAQVMFITGA